MRWLQLADARIGYEIVGRGPTVLFIQGVGVAGCGWSPQLQDLARTHRCVTFDNRGLGASTGDLHRPSVETLADDALALIRDLDRGAVHLVGHSLGGVIAQCIALRRPDVVRSLALLCTFAGGRDLRRPSARLLWLGMRARLGTRRMRRQAFARLVSSDAYIARWGMQATVRELEVAFGRRLCDAPAIADSQLAALREYDERSQLSRLRGFPTIVMSGGEDPIARPEFGWALVQRIHGARYYEWEHGSHALPIQHAVEVNRLLREHFERAQPARARHSEPPRALRAQRS